MNNRIILYWCSQVVGWLFVWGINGISLYNDYRLNQKAFILTCIMFFVSIGCTHLVRNYFIRKNYVELKIHQLIPKVVLLSVLVGAFIVVIQLSIDQFIIHFNTKSLPISTILTDILGMSIIVFIWQLFYFIYQYINKARREEIKNLQWEALKNQIELNNLKSQLNPHFMFNSLNSIRALIDLDQKIAKEAITKLSMLLRTSLLMGKKNIVTIEEEIALVQSYLDLEKIRFEERLTFHLDIDPNSISYEIPPLMIQTLAENALKHGISKKLNGGEIQIKTEIKNDKVIIVVRNPGQLEFKRDEKSIGIKNTKDRLRIMFGDQAKFTLIENHNIVEAKIEIKAA